MTQALPSEQCSASLNGGQSLRVHAGCCSIGLETLDSKMRACDNAVTPIHLRKLSDDEHRLATSQSLIKEARVVGVSPDLRYRRLSLQTGNQTLLEVTSCSRLSDIRE